MYLTLAGRIFQILTSVALERPLLCMVIVYLIESPTIASVTLVTSVKLNITLGITVILLLVLLTTVLFSELFAKTVLFSFPACVTLITKTTLADFPASILSMFQVALRVVSLYVSAPDTYLTFAGRIFQILTSVALKLNMTLGITVILLLVLLTTVLFSELFVKTVLFSLPACVTLITKTTLADFPALILSMVQVALRVVSLYVSAPDTYLTPTGRIFQILTSVALDNPLL